jgi:S1 RNA binding domain
VAGIISTIRKRLAMNYLEIDTAEQLLNAFKQCQNAGEEIQLFESLAERENPPLDAFVEILRKIKLETVLALSIQAFGKITNDDVKARLKSSEDLLVLLCEQAKSGATDLIRWSAATTIENVGFSFIDVCQYLTEEPTGIIQRIVQPKVNILIELERKNYLVIRDTNTDEYNNFIRFWTYGASSHAKSKVGIKIFHKLVRAENTERHEGSVYIGSISRIMPNGAFVEFEPGSEGFLPLSELVNYHATKVERRVSVGDEVIVKVTEIDNRGRVFFAFSGIHSDEII